MLAGNFTHLEERSDPRLGPAVLVGIVEEQKSRHISMPWGQGSKGEIDTASFQPPPLPPPCHALNSRNKEGGGESDGIFHIKRFIPPFDIKLQPLHHIHNHNEFNRLPLSLPYTVTYELSRLEAGDPIKVNHYKKSAIIVPLL